MGLLLREKGACIVAMMKLTWFFKGAGGWSESWYKEFSQHDAALTDFAVLRMKRLKFLGKAFRITHSRASIPFKPRDGVVAKLVGALGNGMDGVTAAPSN